MTSFIAATFIFQLWFTADNGAGSIISKFVPEMNNKLCDGAWHTVKGKVVLLIMWHKLLKAYTLEPISQPVSHVCSSICRAA